jgi:hypothetical protein
MADVANAGRIAKVAVAEAECILGGTPPDRHLIHQQPSTVMSKCSTSSRFPSFV